MQGGIPFNIGEKGLSDTWSRKKKSLAKKETNGRSPEGFSHENSRNLPEVFRREGGAAEKEKFEKKKAKGCNKKGSFKRLCSRL